MVEQIETGVVRVIDPEAANCPSIPLIDGSGSAVALLWPGNGARLRTLHLLKLNKSDRTFELEHKGDAVFYVLHGQGAVRDLKRKVRTALVEGAMIHIDAGDLYQFEADAGSELTLVGGPCPADENLYSRFEKD